MCVVMCRDLKLDLVSSSLSFSSTSYPSDFNLIWRFGSLVFVAYFSVECTNMNLCKFVHVGAFRTVVLQPKGRKR